GIRRARSLLDQLLTLARVQDASHEDIQAVPLQQVFRQVLEDLMPLAQAKNIDVGVVGHQEARVMAPHSDLQTLVKNLVDNAIRYTPRDGQINLSAESDEHGVILQVVDTGPGIAPEERERVFDAFYRVLGQDEAGSGLGLSIVRNIADRLGAKINLAHANESARTGLRVTVTFASTGSPAIGNPAPPRPAAS
ncbi:MAG: sensor histidine kinase, partial [Rhodoferax sp.]